MLPCLLCSKIDGETLVRFKRHLAPCVNVPKWPWDKDPSKAVSSEMVQSVLQTHVGTQGKITSLF